MFFNKQVTVVRSLAGAYNEDGVWQDGQTQELTILANVQPLNQRETEQYTQILAGGNRTISMVKVYTKAILLTDVQMTGQTADILVWRGKHYKIAMVEEWQSNIISHFRYIGVEVIQDEFSK